MQPSDSSDIFERMPTDHCYLDRIAGLAPQLKESLDTLKAEWSPEVVPVTVAGAGLAHAIVEHFEQLPKDTMKSVFELCEQALENGSAEEQIALSTGFLESLQHADGKRAFDFRALVSFLGPKSKEHCLAMDKFWKATTRGL
ncbi:hypothetical protein [Bradyrhizobium sp. 170]|uniref:DUF7674 family protein n=1 Tax=Bradyrhizobium sp. 170 TaxID=2782641 RepID=UPI0020002D01|nr:hypothetical protein [Bradyrhizobium sp. 170]UPK02597.1 hypothetical protein IVB05_34260 [Bradyrhizobium sp. 170]